MVDISILGSIPKGACPMVEWFILFCWWDGMDVMFHYWAWLALSLHPMVLYCALGVCTVCTMQSVRFAYGMFFGV